jgi:hypothetical protein
VAETSKEKEQLALAKFVSANPFAHLTHREMALLLDVGEKIFAKVVTLKPPMLANKINPRRFDKWADENAETLRSIIVK